LKKSFLFCFAIIFTFRIVAQIPPGYYDPAAGQTGLPLKIALHNIIKNHTSVTYASLLTHFQTTDVQQNGNVWDMYSDVPGGVPPYQFLFGQNCGNYSGEGDCYNREHSWPSSWFGDATPMYTDMFHLYPTDGYVNNRRSNYPFGDVGTVTWTSLNGSKLGGCSDAGYSGIVFEPIDSFKGDFARSIFYMSVRYFTEDSGWPGSTMTTGAEINSWAIAVLKTWNDLDPVSQKEVNRNNIVYTIQHNRNPFIDHPEWIDSVWTMPTAIYEESLTDKFIILPNPSSGFFSINCSQQTHTPITILIYSTEGKEMLKKQINTTDQTVKSNLDLSDFKKGIYFIKIISINNVMRQKIVLQ